MIIDQILDRREGYGYEPREFYDYCQEDGPGYGWNIARAMDYGNEHDVKFELCLYVVTEGYNPEICDYINSVKWL